VAPNVGQTSEAASSTECTTDAESSASLVRSDAITSCSEANSNSHVVRNVSKNPTPELACHYSQSAKQTTEAATNVDYTIEADNDIAESTARYEPVNPVSASKTKFCVLQKGTKKPASQSSLQLKQRYSHHAKHTSQSPSHCKCFKQVVTDVYSHSENSESSGGYELVSPRRLTAIIPRLALFRMVPMMKQWTQYLNLQASIPKAQCQLQAIVLAVRMITANQQTIHCKSDVCSHICNHNGLRKTSQNGANSRLQTRTCTQMSAPFVQDTDIQNDVTNNNLAAVSTEVTETKSADNNRSALST